VDREVLERFVGFLRDSGLNEIELTIRTAQHQTYEGEDFGNILEAADEEGSRITSIRIEAHEEWDSKIHRSDAANPIDRKWASMTTFGSSLDFSISGGGTMWGPYARSQIEELVNKGTWKEKISQNLWLAVPLFVLAGVAGYFGSIALDAETKVYAITTLCLIGAWVFYGIFFALMLRRDSVRIIPYRYKANKTERRLTTREKKMLVWGFMLGLLGTAVGTAIVLLILGKD
jgi:hypothetical protein